jgi:hypothetical protein
MLEIDVPIVPIELYAAVVAALGEGYPLAAVLEHEGLSLDAWETADEQWALRLQGSAEGDLSLFDALDRALVAQRVRFSRALEPLDEDLDAFLAFQRHIVVAAQPTARLAAHGLSLGDWTRLQERWAERLVADADVRMRIAAALSSPDMPPLPTVRPEPRKMPPPLRQRSEVPARVASAQADDGDSVEWGLAALFSKTAPTA